MVSGGGSRLPPRLMISIPSDTEALGGSEGREWEGAGQARLCFRGGRGAEQALRAGGRRVRGWRRAGGAAESGRRRGGHKGGVLPPREICLTSGKYRLQRYSLNTPPSHPTDGRNE